MTRFVGTTAGDSTIGLGSCFDPNRSRTLFITLSNPRLGGDAAAAGTEPLVLSGLVCGRPSIGASADGLDGLSGGLSSFVLLPYPACTFFFSWSSSSPSSP